ncbi:unnamed protein product, partial [Ectocarpus sp. 13 AM-2016]
GLGRGAAEESPSARTPVRHQNGSGLADADGSIPIALSNVENDGILLAESRVARAAAGAAATMPSVPLRSLGAASSGSLGGGSVPAPPAYAQATPGGSGSSSSSSISSTGGGSSSTGEARGQGDDLPNAPPSGVSAAGLASGGFGHGGGGGGGGGCGGGRGEEAARTGSDNSSSAISSGASPVAPDAEQHCVSSGQDQAGGKGTGVGSGSISGN